MANASEIIADWPEESGEAAKLVIDVYGEPHETTPSLLIWYDVGPWRRLVADKNFSHHNFPAPHTDSVESFICHLVPLDKFSPLAQFDGSVVANRTKCELSARCHDEQANFLALNLANDIITGAKSVEEARAYYAKEFLDYRRGKPTPYMERFRFDLAGMEDPDIRLITEEDLASAMAGKG
jgi:hypothetical protein